MHNELSNHSVKYMRNHSPQSTTVLNDLSTENDKFFCYAIVYTHSYIHKKMYECIGEEKATMYERMEQLRGDGGSSHHMKMYDRNAPYFPSLACVCIFIVRNANVCRQFKYCAENTESTRCVTRLEIICGAWPTVNQIQTNHRI